MNPAETTHPAGSIFRPQSCSSCTSVLPGSSDWLGLPISLSLFLPLCLPFAVPHKVRERLALLFMILKPQHWSGKALLGRLLLPLTNCKGICLAPLITFIALGPGWRLSYPALSSPIQTKSFVFHPCQPACCRIPHSSTSVPIWSPRG